ncbi:Nif3-like dinuclear metal center hexameric protein [soil metagenome]
MSVRLREVTELLETWYDPAWAADWDAVGLVCGDPDQPIDKILLAVDPAPPVVSQAEQWGADLVVVHHPLLLTPVHSVAATSPKGRLLHRLIQSGTALFTAHTNADVPAGGVNDALARAVGVVDASVVIDEAREVVEKIVVFVPAADAEQVRSALTRAGAGALGAYDSCTFTTSGEGRFRPLEGAVPAQGSIGKLEVVPEVRIECRVPESRREAVVEAMLAAHPYEEPAYDVVALANAARPSTRGHGRIGGLTSPTTLAAFAEHVAAVLPVTAHGIRVAGDQDRKVETVVVASGAGDFMLDDVLTLGADVYLTSDLRHHRAAEFLEHEATALVDVAHWAAEWTWLPVVERKLLEALTGRGATVETRVSSIVTDPWTFRAGP